MSTDTIENTAVPEAEETAVGKKGITGAALKWIAILSMLIDHIGATLIENGIYVSGSYTSAWVAADLVLRSVGRLAFPIFCFLLVQGFLHTKDMRKYLLRLMLFGVLSEIPFDLAFQRSYMDWNYQNVYFTLLLGLLAIWLWQRMDGPGFHRVLAAAAALACVALAWLGKTDYGGWGVALIVVLYLLRDKPLWRNLAAAAALAAANLLEVFGYFDFLLFRSYNGERGRQPKYLFYVFYPLHIGALALIRYLIYGF